MNSQFWIAILTSAVAIFVAAISYWFAKSKEREADWRKWKYEQYKEFIAALSGLAGPNRTDTDVSTFTRNSNTLHLIGSEGALRALHGLIRELVRSGNSNQDEILMNKLVSKLVWEVRNDLGIPNPPDSESFSVKLSYNSADQRKSSNQST